MSAPGSTVLSLPVRGMTCASCVATLEKALQRLPSVSASVNFASERVRVQYDQAQVQPAAIVASIGKAGKAQVARELLAVIAMRLGNTEP